MTKSLSEDLRSRVIAAVDAGLSRRAAADRFGVGTASAIRWVREWRVPGLPARSPKAEIGDHAASKRTGRRFWRRSSTR